MYLRSAPTRFERREVSDYQPLGGGWFVGGGLEPGDRIVVTGAQILLGVDTAALGGGAD